MVEHYECNGCGAHLEWDPSAGKLSCEYCGSEEAVPLKQEAPEEHPLEEAPRETGWDAPVTSLECKNCGASTVVAEGATAECAFCGSTYVIGHDTGRRLIRPEHLVPFRISVEDATRRFGAWLKKGFFRPSDLKKIGRMGRLKGVYVPFWTYDTATHSEWTAQSGYYYYETERYTTTVNGRRTTRTRQVRKIRWVPSSGKRNDFYNDHLVVASRGLDKALVKKIEPFHMGPRDLVKYAPEFLSGFLAEEYAIDVQGGWGIAMDELRSAEISKCSRDVPGDTHRFLRVNTWFNDVTYKHILLPVWIASYDYKGKNYKFLVNGQTGELHGYAPISWFKVAMVVGAIAGAVAGLYFLLA